MIFLLLTTLAVTFPGHLSAEIGSKCDLPFKPVQFGFFAPLIFDADEKFAVASNTSTVLAPQERVTLSCEPGYFKSFPKIRTLTAKCIGGDELELEDGTREQWSKSFACELRAVEEVLTQSLTGCPSEAESSEFGYINPFTKKSIIVGETCYNVTKGQIIFVHAKASAAGLKNEDETRLRRGPHPDTRSKVEFFKALRYDAIYDRYKNTVGPPNKVLSFIYRSLLTGPMLSQPQLQLMTRLTWNYAISHADDSLKDWTVLRDGVEKFTARNSAAEVWVGTSGVAKVKDIAGTSWDFYLQYPKFPVPKYHWIVVKVDNKASGFLFRNTPSFMNTPNSDNEEPKVLQQICQRKCREFSWLEGTEGIRCCSVEELRQVVPEVPPISGIHGELPPKQDKDASPQGESMIL